jgi:very-short-patch-repair endonuclease
MKIFANELRKNLTPAEAILWHHIKLKKLGVKFRRQYVVDNFIIDFFCFDLKLGIEVDGGIHLDIINQSNDEIRENLIEQKGISIIRFSNDEIYNNIDLVLQNIKEKIINIKTE